MAIITKHKPIFQGDAYLKYPMMENYNEIIVVFSADYKCDLILSSGNLMVTIGWQIVVQS